MTTHFRSFKFLQLKSEKVRVTASCFRTSFIVSCVALVNEHFTFSASVPLTIDDLTAVCHRSFIASGDHLEP